MVLKLVFVILTNEVVFMSCFRPRVGYSCYKDGVKKMRFSNWSSLEHWSVLEGDVSNVASFDVNTGEFMGPFVVPCGRCEGCLLSRASMWATRIVMEMESFPDSSYFVTLTYDDNKLPQNFLGYNQESIFNSDGSMCLRKSHLQDFFKRLRDRVDYSVVRYFAAGEYGSLSMRPHFHICLMGCKLDLFAFGRSSGTGMILFRSPLLEQIWPFGYVSVAPLNFATAAYTARYCQKKAYGKSDEYYSRLGLSPEFTVMSRRPGLGTDYFLNHPEIFDGDGTIVLPASSKDRSHVVPIPRFFMDKLKNDSSQGSQLKYASLKEFSRLRSLEAVYDKLILSDYDENTFFDVREAKFSESYKKLVRTL